MNQLLSLALLVCLFITACKKTDPDTEHPQALELTSNKTTLALNGTVASIDSFTVQSNSKWTLTIAPDTAAWIKTSVTNGETGTTKVFVTILHANTTGADRTATIMITPEADPSKPLSIEVTQQPFTIEPWSKVYGGSVRDNFDAVLPTPDSGYIMVGSTESNDGDVSHSKGQGDAWVVKVAQNGAIQWEKTFGGSGYDYMFSITSSGDGGYLLAGDTNSGDGDITAQKGGYDVWLIKLDANGNMIWQKTYGGTGDEYASAIVPAVDGGFIVNANSTSGDGDVSNRISSIDGLYDWWIFKIDASGNMLWSKSFGGALMDISVAMIPVNGGYLITGWTESTDYDGTGNHGGNDALVVKIDESGNKVWSHVFGGTLGDELMAATESQDGTITLTGATLSSDGDVSGTKGETDVWVVKLNEYGLVLWDKTFGGTDFDNGRYIVPGSNGGYVITGTSKSRDVDVTTNHGGEDGWVLALDSGGNLVGQKSFGGSAGDYPTMLQKGADGYYTLVGVTNSSDADGTGNHGGYDAWAVKFTMP